ncbi:MAG: hypothetical protein KGO93_07720 [Cyanobacteria bacterium REEB446]|nr:hypothetical protein [Cyanobacteria bacterium REEB446]
MNISKKLLGSALALGMAASMTAQVSAQANNGVSQVFVDTVAHTEEHKCGAGKCGSGKCGKDGKKPTTPAPTTTPAPKH